MRILLYEYLTGGGLWSDEPGDPLCQPLLAEGRAMAEAVSCDLQRVDGVRAVTFRDSRLSSACNLLGDIVTITSAAHEFEALAHWSRCVDGVMLIAPEHGGRLLDRSRWVEQHGGRLLSPDSSFVTLASDKSRTTRVLAAAGVAVPYALCLEPGEPIPEAFPFPAVLKPNDGVGSLETHLVADHMEAERLRARYGDTRRLEAYCPGLPASVLALCGPCCSLLLPPCQQHMTCAGQFEYRGGKFPLATDLAQRAERLAQAAFAALPHTNGFVGVDMILGDAADGACDVVLEVNPRLTTSYVGLRQGTASNLAAAMLTIQRGDPCPLFFQDGAVEFQADGRIRQTGPSSSTAL
jgi:tyramine---L-glutamate ligase